MKKINRVSLLAVVLVMGLVSCEKGNHDDCMLEDKQSNETNTGIETPESFVEAIPAVFDEMAVLGGTENEAFYMENEGIPVFLDEEPFGVEELDGKKGDPCRLNGELELNKEQKEKLMASWKHYLECRKMAMMKMRAAHRELHNKMENRREELVKALKAERITEKEFKAAMEKLRQEFKELSIKQRRMHHSVIQHCYKSFLEKVQHILSPEQFKVFMHCHKLHLNRK